MAQFRWHVQCAHTLCIYWHFSISHISASHVCIAELHSNTITVFSSCICGLPCMHACTHFYYNAFFALFLSSFFVSFFRRRSRLPPFSFTSAFLQLPSSYTVQARFKNFHKFLHFIHSLTLQPNSEIDDENLCKCTYFHRFSLTRHVARIPTNIKNAQKKRHIERVQVSHLLNNNIRENKVLILHIRNGQATN